MPALDSLLDNPAVISYLENLGSDRVLPASADRTNTSEFRAGVAALDEGIDGERKDEDPAESPSTLFPVLADAPHGYPPAGAVQGALDSAVTLVFLMGMTLVGASAAALVFRAQLQQILSR